MFTFPMPFFFSYLMMFSTKGLQLLGGFWLLESPVDWNQFLPCSFAFVSSFSSFQFVRWTYGFCSFHPYFFLNANLYVFGYIRDFVFLTSFLRAQVLRIVNIGLVRDKRSAWGGIWKNCMHAKGSHPLLLFLLRAQCLDISLYGREKNCHAGS